MAQKATFDWRAEFARQFGYQPETTAVEKFAPHDEGAHREGEGGRTEAGRVDCDADPSPDAAELSSPSPLEGEGSSSWRSGASLEEESLPSTRSGGEGVPAGNVDTDGADAGCAREPTAPIDRDGDADDGFVVDQDWLDERLAVSRVTEAGSADPPPPATPGNEAP